MKKFLVPGLVMLFAVGLGQRDAKAGGFSFNISIGDHRHALPAVVVAPAPVYVPAPVCGPRPPVVIVQPEPYCDRGYAVVRECERPRGYYRHEHDRYRYEHRRDGYRR
jgi:hypothetical protein